jgi:tripeptide aminopeptidase
MQPVKLTEAERERLLDRFLRYVRVDTQSDDNATCSPSTAKQKDLSRLLAGELRALGCADAAVDEWGYVTATVGPNLPADRAAKVPVVGLIAHVDTYSGTPGGGVKPAVVRGYAGGDLALSGTPGQAIVAADNPNLARCVGHTLVHTDGTTLLGADDKAGVAEIVTAVEWLLTHPEYSRGRVRVGFTTDEEVGRGTEHFDVAAFGANVAYTLDGSDLGEVEDETFCADSASVVFTGHDVHPGYAKGKMINAVRAAARLVERLDGAFLPETTDGRQSYLHAYDVRGDVTRVEVKLLVRAFTVEELAAREDALRAAVAAVEAAFPGVRAAVEIKESYRNMGLELAKTPEVLRNAFEAVRRQGIEPVCRAIRGGTDGSRLTFMGLPTPNVFAGGQNFHSVQEWVSLEWMAAAVETAISLVGVWAEKG